MRFLVNLLGKVKGLSASLPKGPTLRKLGIVVAFFACTALAFWYGRQGAPQVGANTTDAHGGIKPPKGPLTDYQKRVVAEIYGEPISREDLGEYLIARFGDDRIGFLVDRKIVERECNARGVFVSDAEVDLQLKYDIQGMGKFMTEQEFVTNILKRFNKTLYEWKEDVIRPKLMLTKLCRPMVEGKVTQEEIKKEHERRYGERVEVRLICYAKDDNTPFRPGYLEGLKSSEEKFIQAANTQFIHHLASVGGKVPAITRHFADKVIETEAFSLKEGDVSSIKKLADGTRIIMKCDKRLPAENTWTVDSVRLKLEKEIEEQKLAAKIPEVYNELRKAASPKVYIGPARLAVGAPPALKEANAE